MFSFRIPALDSLDVRNMAVGSYLTAVVAFMLAVLIAPSLSWHDPASHGRASLADNEPVSGNGALPASARPAARAPAESGPRDTASPALEAMGGDYARAGNPFEEGQSFIPLDFALDRGDEVEAAVASATDGSIRVRKVVQAGNTQMGAVEITIDRKSSLLIDVADARKLLAQNGMTTRSLAALPASGLVSFKTLRERGVDLRYDPDRDLVVLETG